jgi:cytoskeletal protein CcmA (bactofilin family)
MSNPYDLGEKKHTSVLGPTLSFKGELKAEEDLLIRGRVEGTIEHTSNLTIGKDGKVKADIKAEFIAVEGQVVGDLTGSKSVVIKDTADIKGNIYSPTVSLHEGSTFNGKINMTGKEEAVKQVREATKKIGDVKATDKSEVVAQADTKETSKPKKQASSAA